MISVLLVDDHPLIRMGFRLVLDAEDDIEVVGEAADGTAAVSMCSALRPDVVLMDVRMPGHDGIEATRDIVAAGLPCKVLILTTFGQARPARPGPSRRARLRIQADNPRHVPARGTPPAALTLTGRGRPAGVVRPGSSGWGDTGRIRRKEDAIREDAALDAVTRTRADVRAVVPEVERIEAMTPA